VGLLAFSVASAQDTSNMASDPATGNNEIGSETVEKTYSIHSNGQVIRNSVRVTTTTSQEILLEEEDKDKVEQDRVTPMKRITKTVLIDNDDDEQYDEKIVFSYMAVNDSDFTLVSNDDQLMVAVDEGENLNIIESEVITLDNLKSNKEAYVFTNEKGETVQFYIEDYKSME
jgi:hypothetical protein